MENNTQTVTPLSPTIPTETVAEITTPQTPPITQPLDITVSTKQKSKTTIKVIVLFIIVLLLGVAGFFGTNAVTSMRTTFNPAISPLIEDLFFTPGEQLTARLNLLLDISGAGISSELKDLGITVATDYTDKEMAQYKTLIGSKLKGGEMAYEAQVTYESEQPVANEVLGVNTNGGKIDQEFLSELMSTKKITATLSGMSEFDIQDREKPNSRGNSNLQLELPNSQAAIRVDTLNNGDKGYLSLKAYPENDYLDLSSLVDKWLEYDLDFSNTLELSRTQSAKKPVTMKRNDITNTKQLLSIPELVEKVAKAPQETIGGVTAKCYLLKFNEEESKEITTALNNKAKELKTTSFSGLLNVTSSTTTTICFTASQFVPTKITTNSTVVNDKTGTKTTQTSMVTLGKLSDSANFDLPSSDQTMLFENIDYTSLLKPAALEYINSLNSGLPEENYRQE